MIDTWAHGFIPTATSCCNCYRYSTYFATEDHLCKNQQTVKPEATAIQQFAYYTAEPNSLARARLTWMFVKLSQPIANSTMENLVVLFRIFTNWLTNVDTSSTVRHVEVTRRAEKPKWRPPVPSRCGPRRESARSWKKFPVLGEKPYTANAYIVSLKCFHKYLFSCLVPRFRVFWRLRLMISTSWVLYGKSCQLIFKGNGTCGTTGDIKFDVVKLWMDLIEGANWMPLKDWMDINFICIIDSWVW
jgi:hypothetical protein